MSRSLPPQKLPNSDSPGVLTPTPTIIRTDTVFAKLPIHNLAKGQVLRIHIAESNEKGSQNLFWQVSPSTSYGAPQLLAYRLDTLLINRHLDALKRPLPTIIRIGSLRYICQELGLRVGKSVDDIKNAFHQNAGAYITAKLTYCDTSGKQRRLEAGFNRYGVVFTGKSLPDGTSADAVYIVLNESYRQVLNAAPTRPIDYDYLSCLKPLAQRFYELLSFRMYAAVKYQQPQVSMRYSEFCLYAPQRRYDNRTQMSKQMYKVHHPHLQSGYIASVKTEPVIDPEGHPDWLLCYTPGPKAQTEYRMSTSQDARVKSPLRIVTETKKLEAAVSDKSEINTFNLTATEVQTDSAMALVQQCHRMIHGVNDKTPHHKEIERATRLIDQHGTDFSVFFVNFACKAARQDDYDVQVFGGLIRYEGAALAAYRSREARQAKASAEAAEAREMELRQVYGQDWRGQLVAYEASLEPKVLIDLKEEIRTELMGRGNISRVALDLELQLELDQRLSTLADLPSFEDWQDRQSET